MDEQERLCREIRTGSESQSYLLTKPLARLHANGHRFKDSMSRLIRCRRRQLLHHLATRLLLPGMLAGGGLGGYALYEAKRCGVLRLDVTLRNLPAAFEGTTIAFLADTHHGPLNPLGYLEDVVAMTNELGPDIVALGGDFVQRHRVRAPGVDDRRYVVPGVAVLAKLHAPLGRFAVLGNHDYGVDPALTRRALADHGLTELTNRGVWLERGGARLRFCGVDDCRKGRPRLREALGDMTDADAAVVMTHNPDYIERVRDRRVDLVLSGHTHGGASGVSVRGGVGHVVSLRAEVRARDASGAVGAGVRDARGGDDGIADPLWMPAGSGVYHVAGVRRDLRRRATNPTTDASTLQMMTRPSHRCALGAS